MRWLVRGEPAPKKAETVQPAESSDFCDASGISVGYLEKGSLHFMFIIDQLHEVIRQKRSGPSRKDVSEDFPGWQV